MKKKTPVVLAVVLLAVAIAAFRTHIVTKRSGHRGRAIDAAERADGDIPKPHQAQESPGTMAINDDQARAIAREAVGDIEFDEKGEIRVERLEGKIRVVFPVNMETPPGTRYRGPDYAAEVELDAETGKVLRAKLGS
ncbi:MAG: hypothetical protein ACOYCD_08975 [Kiritimatiellia bacterium]|jgi:uncharacterized membrane protein YkoI